MLACWCQPTGVCNMHSMSCRGRCCGALLGSAGRALSSFQVRSACSPCLLHAPQSAVKEAQHTIPGSTERVTGGTCPQHHVSDTQTQPARLICCQARPSICRAVSLHHTCADPSSSACPLCKRSECMPCGVSGLARSTHTSETAGVGLGVSYEVMRG